MPRALRSFLCLLAAGALMSACTSGGTRSSDTTSAPEPSTTVAKGSGPATVGGITWVPCGQVQCGTIDVPASSLEPAGPGLRLALYRRAATAGTVRGTLLLLPDFDGPTARMLAERAVTMVGPAARSFDVVALSPRGFFDSSALPCGAETEWIADDQRALQVAAACVVDRPGTATSLGLLDSADDVERAVDALGARGVRAVGWGRGATILAAWKMTNPSSSSFVVLDSPEDPGVPLARTAAANRRSEDAALAATMLWCTSHISCPLVENAAKRVKFVLDDITSGVSGPATESHFRLAFSRVMRDGDYGGLFRALASAEDADFAPLVGFADAAGSASEASFAARIAAACSDLSRDDASAIIAADAAFETVLFRVGLGSTLPRVCASMPEPSRPFAPVKPVAAARGATVRVYAARGDGITSPTAARALAKRLDWDFAQVGVDDHLVVGRDRATTDAVSQFLTGE
ncbi:MAG: alpha/beta fold hydrolase [Acidimicrobiales bacterium]